MDNTNLNSKLDSILEDAIPENIVAPVDTKPEPIEPEAKEPDVSEAARTLSKSRKSKIKEEPQEIIEEPKGQEDESIEPEEGKKYPIGIREEEKQAYDALNPEAKTAFDRMLGAANRDYKRKVQKLGEDTKLVEYIDKRLQPYSAVMSQNGHTKQGMIEKLLNAQEILEKNPVNGIMHIASLYGVDLARLVGNPQGQSHIPEAAPQASLSNNPEVAELINRLNAVEQQHYNGRLSELTASVESFGKDKPYFEEVADELPKYIQVVRQINPGISPTEALQKAYDLAVNNDPDLREDLVNSRIEAERQKLQDQAKKARSAAVSPSSSSGVQTSRKLNMKTDLDSFLDEKLASAGL